ncbi:MAG: MbnP family protein [Bacteroidota bacterium]
MILKSKSLMIALMAAIALMFTACDNDDEGNPEIGCTDPNAVNYNANAEPGGDCTYPSLRLHFHGKMGSEDFESGKAFAVNGKNVKITTMNFYASNIRLMDDAGNMTNMFDTTLLVKSSQMMYDLGQINKGHGHMLMFDIGVSEDLNGGMAKPPADYPTGHPLGLQAPSMAWSWMMGYIFLRMDGQTDLNGDGTYEDAELTQFHLGTNALKTPVTVMVHSDLDQENNVINIDVDYMKLFEGLDLEARLITHTGGAGSDARTMAEQVASNAATMFSKQK